MHRPSPARLWMVMVAAAVVAAAEGLPTAQQQPVFRSGTAATAVWATVFDRDGRLVPDLTKEDFEVRLGGRPQEITVFSSETQPLTVVLLLDMSGSVAPRMLRIREASRAFVRALTPEDRARIGTFGAETAISPILTNDRNLLDQILREELWPGRSTPLWGAMGAAFDSLAAEPGRRVVLVLTDGAPMGELPGYPARLSQVRERVTRDGFMVYSVGIVASPLLPNDDSLEELARDSGGAHFALRDDADLEATFMRVAEELRRQYLIGFMPDLGSQGTRRLEVRTRGGHRVRTRAEMSVGGVR